MTLGWAQVAPLDSTYIGTYIAGERLRYDGRIDHPGPHGVLPWCREDMAGLRAIDAGRGIPLPLPVPRGIAGRGCGADADQLLGPAALRDGVSEFTGRDYVVARRHSG